MFDDFVLCTGSLIVWLNIVDPCTAVILNGRQFEIVTGCVDQSLRAVKCGSVVWFGDMLPPCVHFSVIGGEIVTATDRGQRGYDLASVFYCGCFGFHFVLCCVVAFAVSPRGDFVPCLGLVSGLETRGYDAAIKFDQRAMVLDILTDCLLDF